ncbi:uncharacterized protein LOC110702921 [Chenopodium quinoa]|nr:uncharacterized protein LOC110702921 [Chenopodium quinoa]
MMAVNMITGGDSSSACSSPRLSFSHDLSETNVTQTQQEIDVARLDMSLLSENQNCEDFDFCVTAAFSETDNSPADELFFNGVIIPIQMKEKLNSINKDEEITSTTTATLVRQEKTQSKSFWRFNRSSSLNCENFSNKRSSSVWSLPLLLRSKSTGSSSHDIVKQTQKNPGSNNGKTMNNNNSQNLKFSSTSCQKPPLRKSGSGGSGSHGNGVRNCAALNVPPPYITKGTSDLLGFGSFFRNGSREKKSKK